MRHLAFAITVVPGFIACGMGAEAQAPAPRVGAHPTRSVSAGVADGSRLARSPSDGSLENETDTERQIRELKRADAQYQQFLDRALDDPRFREAVQKSRDRQEDIRATIAFLEGGRQDQGGD